MTRTFIIAPTFDKNWRQFGLNDDDLRQLQNYLMQNPKSGDVIQGTGGLIKLRWNLPKSGKSGGIRVLYIDFIQHDKIMLANCYAKSQKENITDKEKSLYKELIKTIGKEL